MDVFIKSKLALSTIFAKDHAKLYGKTLNVVFNGEQLNPNFNQFPIDCMEKITINENTDIDQNKKTVGDYLTICVGLNRIDKKAKLQHVTIINGADTPSGGDHIKHYQGLLRDSCKEELQQMQEKNGLKCDYNRLYNKLFIITSGFITNARYSWTD